MSIDEKKITAAKPIELEAFNEIDSVINKEFNDIVDISKIDTKVKVWYDSGVYSFNYICSKNLFGAYPRGRVIGIEGLPGCLAPDTKIVIKRGKRTTGRTYTIKEVYDKLHGKGKYAYRKWNKNIPLFTYSLRENGLIQYHEINDIIYSGEKELYLLRTKAGKEIKCTNEHPFKVPEEYIKNRGNKLKDNFVELKDLTPGDIIICKGNIQSFLKDDRIENLEILSKEEHDKLHSKKRENGIITQIDIVESIEFIGKSPTYDVIMKDPYRNYVANEIVVHNTGKSLMCATAMRDPKIDYVIIIETEGGGHSKELIDFSFQGITPKKVRVMKANTFASYKITKSTGKIEEIHDDVLPANKAKWETDKYVLVEGVTNKVRRFLQTIQFNKIKKNIFVILDSLGNIQSVRGLSGTPDMGKRGQDFNNFFKNFDYEFEKSNTTFVFTNKMYSKMDQYDPFASSGGHSPLYNSSLYIRLSNTSETDDKTKSELDLEKDRKKSALGSSIKTIRATIRKSRFGTEWRNIPFLLDFSIGPVRLSGLFTLLIDFGVIKKASSSRYIIPEVWSKSFYKKDFVSMVLKDEKNIMHKFQDLLLKREEEIKKERSKIQVSDMEEVIDIVEDNENNPFGTIDSNELQKQMIREIEK